MNKWKVGLMIYIFSVFIFITWMNFNSNRYNNSINWIHSIPIGTSIDSIKKTTPKYIKIDWNNPQKIENNSIYFIKIKWNYDFLKMTNGLVFENDKFKERFVHK